MRGTPFLKENWTGGLNSIDSPYTLAENETRDCLNVVSTERGAIRKRYGSTLFTPTPPEAELTTVASVTVSGVTSLIVAGGGKLWSVSSVGAVTEIGSGFTSDRWCVVQAPKTTGVASQGPVYLSNGKDAPQFWTGSGSVAVWKGVASSPKLTDGVLKSGKITVESASASFISGDVGLTITFETTVKQKAGETTIGTARITSVKSPTEVTVEINEEGWKEAYTGVHFSLNREYFAAGEHVPNGRFMIFAGNRVWMANVEGDTSAVWFSEDVSVGEGGEQADPSAWPKSNVVRFDRSDGKEITGLGTVGPYIVVFKDHKTWAIHDLDTGENRKLADTIGCVAHRSIVETALGTFFLTADQGVFLTDGSKLHEMSYNVRPTILAVNPAQRENAAGAYLNNHYYLSFASGTSSVANRTLDYDVQLKSWWLHDLAGASWAVWAPVAGETALFTLPAKANGGVVKAFVEGIYTDSGKVYAGKEGLAAYWLSPWEPFAYYVFRHRIKAPFLKKRVRAIHFDGEGEIIGMVFKNFQVSGERLPGVVGDEPQGKPVYPVNFALGSTVYGNENEQQVFGGETYEGAQMVFGGNDTIQDARIYAPGVARVWGVGFGNNTAEPFIVDSYAYFVQFRKS